MTARPKPWLPGAVLSAQLSVCSANGPVRGWTWNPAPGCTSCCHNLGFWEPSVKLERHECPAPALCQTWLPCRQTPGCQVSARAMAGCLAHSVTSGHLRLAWVPQDCLGSVGYNEQVGGAKKALPGGHLALASVDFMSTHSG